MKRWLVALGMGALAAGGTALAQDAPRPGGGLGALLRADADGDGAVTRAEYQAEVDRRFARQDTNANGRLDAGEGPGGRMMRGGTGAPPPPPVPGTPPVAGTPPPPPAPDAGLTRDQYRDRSMRRFEGMDTNKDGRLDTAEMQAARPLPRGPGGPPPPAAPPTPRPAG